MKPIELAIKQAGGQQSLADHLGVSQPTVSEWVTGVRPIPTDRRIQIEQVPGVTVSCEELGDDVTWVRIPDPAWPRGKPLLDKTPQLAPKRKADHAAASKDPDTAMRQALTQRASDRILFGAAAAPVSDKPNNSKER